MKTYETINDFVRDLPIDKTHWINQEGLKFVKKKVYDQTEVNLTHIPIELIHYKVQCENGHIFTPDWLEKRPPFSVFKLEGGYERQKSTRVACPECGCEANVEFPVAKIEDELNIYGDEAYRFIDNKSALIYSFLSFSGSQLVQTRFERKIRKVKEKLVPSKNPDEWELHIKDLVSSDKRSNTDYLSHLDSKDVSRAIRDLIKIVRDFNKDKYLNIYCGVGIYDGNIQSDKETKHSCQSNVYNSVLMRVIRETTANNLMPCFYFERTGDDGWAKKLFDGGRLTILWPFIANGLPVKSPEFVEPSFSIYLQIADLISYVVARHIYLIGKSVELGMQQDVEFDSSLLGDIRYMLTNATKQGNGNWVYKNQRGFPFKEMFGETDWEPYIR